MLCGLCHFQHKFSQKKKKKKRAEVSELIDESSSKWKQDLVTTVFLPIDTDLILNVPLSMRQLHDFWAWGHESKRNFTVRSAYRMLVTTKQIEKHGWRDGLEIVEGSRSHGVNYGT